MRFSFATIYVKNMSESEAFYKDVLNMSVATSFSPQPGVKITFLKDEAGNALELIENPADPRKFEIFTGLVSLCYAVESLADTLKMLEKKQISVSRGPVEVPGGVKFAYINDPNGAEIQFIEGFRL